jgi:hypothetical protein
MGPRSLLPESQAMMSGLKVRPHWKLPVRVGAKPMWPLGQMMRRLSMFGVLGTNGSARSGSAGRMVWGMNPD